MAKDKDDQQKQSEKKAKAFGRRVDKWTDRHFTDPDRPECPVCRGIKWIFVANEVKLGAITVYPRYCLSCGYTMFFNADLIG